MLDAEREIEAYKREMLRQRLEQCTEPQREFFKKVWPEPIAARDLNSAIAICDRTIKKNKAGRT